MPQLLLYRSLFFRPSIQSNTIRPPNSTRHIPSDDKIPETSEISRLPSGYCVLILLRGYSSRFHGSLYIRFVLYVVFRRPHETPINFSKIRETIMRNLHAGLFREYPQQDISQPWGLPRCCCISKKWWLITFTAIYIIFVTFVLGI
jgi:hypothetical protein